jgi:heme-degrading monooxygenase HmoA
MHARVNTFDGKPEDFDAAMKQVREKVLPAARQIPGFAGMISLGDRQTGRAIGITLWESEEALRASEEAATAVRQTGPGSVAGVERYEVTGLFLEEHVASEI